MVYKKKRFLKKKGSFKKRVTAKKMTIKKIVKMEIARAVEDKTTQQYNIGRSIYPPNHTNFPDNTIELGICSAMPISQGTGQGARIGNKIKTKKLIFGGTIVPYPYGVNNTTPTPSQVAVYIFYDRTDPTAIPQVTTNFFQAGSSTRGFSNDLADLMYPVNTDRYRILAKKTFKLGYSAYTGTGFNIDAQGFTNNDFKLNCNFRFDLTKHYPQQVKFDDNNSTPTTRGLFALFVPMRADGNAYTATTIPMGYQFFQNYVYEDA